MNRRTLTTMALLGLAVVALPQAGLAQNAPALGTWKLNLAKSTYDPGPPPRNSIRISEAVGQSFRSTFDVVDAQGNATKAILGPYLFDGKPYPVTGTPAFDAASYKSVSDSAAEVTLMKAGKVVQITTSVVSADGKTLTQTSRSVPASGQQINNVAVYDKQ
jgi:hypothetical protein